MKEEFQMDYSEIQKTVEQLLPEKFPVTFEELVKQMINETPGKPGEFFREVAEWLFASVSFPVEHGVKLLFLILFSALFSNLSKAFSKDGTSNMGYLCVYVLMAVHTASGFMSSLRVTAEGMENLCCFVSVLLPMYCISIAVVTGSVTAAGYYQGTAFLLGFFEYLTRFCLIPLAQAYLLITFASCIQKRHIFRRLLELIAGVFSWIRKTMLGIVIAFGAVQGILAPAVDGLKRTAVVQSASIIPGVGNLIGGAWETVLGAGIVLRNAIGLIGIIFLILVVMVPILKLALHYLIYRVLAAITEPVTKEMTEWFLIHLGVAHRLLMEILALGVMIFVLLLVVMTRIAI